MTFATEVTNGGGVTLGAGIGAVFPMVLVMSGGTDCVLPIGVFNPFDAKQKTVTLGNIAAVNGIVIAMMSPGDRIELIANCSCTVTTVGAGTG